MIMSTDISPIFGLSLIELIEWGAIIGAIIGVGASCIVAAAIRKGSKEQLALQEKVESTKLARELHSSWRNNAEFQDILAKINNRDITMYRAEEAYPFLNKFEDIATFWNDDILMDMHVRSLFGANLKTIRKDDHLKLYIIVAQQKNPRAFIYLKKLLQKSEEWDPD